MEWGCLDFVLKRKGLDCFLPSVRLVEVEERLSTLDRVAAVESEDRVPVREKVDEVGLEKGLSRSLLSLLVIMLRTLTAAAMRNGEVRTTCARSAKRATA